MSYEEMIEKVKELVKARATKNSDDIACDKNLKEEYCINSIGITELVFDIEDAFGIQFDSNALAFDNLSCVTKIADYVQRKLNE